MNTGIINVECIFNVTCVLGSKTHGADMGILRLLPGLNSKITVKSSTTITNQMCTPGLWSTKAVNLT